jgi:hypothetical protein
VTLGVRGEQRTGSEDLKEGGQVRGQVSSVYACDTHACGRARQSKQWQPSDCWYERTLAPPLEKVGQPGLLSVPTMDGGHVAAFQFSMGQDEHANVLRLVFIGDPGPWLDAGE